MVYLPIIGKTQSHTESQVPSEVKLQPRHDKFTSNDDTSYQGTVNDITKSTATGTVDTNVQLYFPLKTGSTKSKLIPKPHSDSRHNSKGMSPMTKNCTCGASPDMHDNGHGNSCVQELDTQNQRRRRGAYPGAFGSS